jgi:nucleoside-diphosphate-sugar epimerase
MRVLVTGGAGFIGSHIVGRLIDQGIYVTVLDNLSSGKYENILEFENNPVFSFVKGDVADFELCLSLSKRTDYIIHLAALVSVPKSIELPLLNHSSTLTGFINILEATRINSVKKIVYASSAAVYGIDETIPKVEEVTDKAASPYALAKYVDELYARLYYDLYGVKSIGLRYFNVYGPKQDPSSAYSGVISIFIDKATKNKNLLVYGDGENTRDFIFIDDVVQANLLAMKTQEVSCDVFNVGTEIETSINQLAAAIKEITSNKKPIIYLSSRIGDIKKSVASIKRINQSLSFIPSTNLEIGLAKTINWYKNRDSSFKE